jgi:hypothetical protein
MTVFSGIRSISSLFLVKATLLLVLFSANNVAATALTYKIEANERGCFYAWVDKVGEKIAFYFAVTPISKKF